MRIIDIEQNTPVWLEMRKGRIGGSDAPIVMLDSPWTTPMQLWEEKQGLGKPRLENSAMRHGKEVEEAARQLYIEMTGVKMLPAVVENDTYPWMICSLDGISEDNKKIVEIKRANREDHELAKQGLVPRKYFAQLQHHIAGVEVDMIDYFSYNEKEGVIVQVLRDDAYIEALIEAEKKFWDCVQTFTPPALCERDFNKRYDNEWRFACINYQQACETFDAAEQLKETMRLELISASKNQNSSGCGMKVQKITRKGSINYSEISVLKEIDLDQYRKPCSTTWRITKEDE